MDVGKIKSDERGGTEDGKKGSGKREVEVIKFFFSSRRRHTRLVSDWSSDVCSSDLKKGRATSGH